MDRRLRELVRQYNVDSSLGPQVFRALLRSNTIPQKWLCLLKFLGEPDVCHSQVPLTGFIDSMVELRSDVEDYETWELRRDIFPFSGSLDEEGSFFEENPVTQELLVYLVGCYLRETLAWVFNESSYIKVFTRFNKRRRKKRGAPTNTLNQLKNDTRSSIASLLAWEPNRDVIEVNSDWWGIIENINDDFALDEGDGYDPDDLESVTSQRENYFFGTFSWLFQMLGDDIAYPNRICPAGCDLWDYNITRRRKLCPVCRGSLTGPDTTLSRMASPYFYDAYQYDTIIMVCYALWKHSGYPVDVLHQRILSSIKEKIIALVLL